MIAVGAPQIGEAELRAVEEVLRSGWLVQGRAVRAFEEAVAAYLGIEHAVAVSSGTAALHLALLAHGIGPGDEVLVPDFTFPASANAVVHAGATPVLVDVRLDTFNADVERLSDAVTVRTRAVLPVHLFGLPADMDPILEMAQAHHLLVIEDAACALGAEYRGRKCGTLGDAGCFSFHPRKVITTGEGGMVVTRDAGVAETVRSLRSHGAVSQDGELRFAHAGYNYRMTDMQGAMGIEQMRRLDVLLAQRAALAARYDSVLAGIAGLTRPRVPEGLRSTWQAYVVLLPADVDRTRLREGLRDAGIETTIGTYAVSAQPHYAGDRAAPPRSREAHARSLALPLHPGMAEADVDVVAQALRAALA